MTGSYAGREGSGHTQNNTILLLKELIDNENLTDHRKLTGSPQTCPRNDVSTIPSHPQHNGTIHFLGGWSYTRKPDPHTPQRLVLAGAEGGTDYTRLARNITFEMSHSERDVGKHKRVSPVHAPALVLVSMTTEVSYPCSAMSYGMHMAIM